MCEVTVVVFLWFQARLLMSPAAKFWSYKTKIRYDVPLQSLFNVKYSVSDEEFKVRPRTKMKTGLTGTKRSHMYKCIII